MAELERGLPFLTFSPLCGHVHDGRLRVSSPRVKGTYDRVGFLLKRAQAALRSKMDHALDVNGLSTPQYAVLTALEREPGISNADLARRAFVTPQTMIRIVEKLEALRFIVRQSHATHGKVLTASLTPQGARLVASCHSAVDAVESRMLSSMDVRERATLQALLKRCAAALEDD